MTGFWLGFFKDFVIRVKIKTKELDFWSFVQNIKREVENGEGKLREVEYVFRLSAEEEDIKSILGEL